MAEVAETSHPGILCINWMTGLGTVNHPLGDEYFCLCPIDDDSSVLGSCLMIKRSSLGAAKVRRGATPILNKLTKPKPKKDRTFT